jgi:hypothetical protein
MKKLDEAEWVEGLASPLGRPKVRVEWTADRRYLKKPPAMTATQQRIAVELTNCLQRKRGNQRVDISNWRGHASEIAHRTGISERTVSGCLSNKKFRDAYLWPLINRLLFRLMKGTAGSPGPGRDTREMKRLREEQRAAWEADLPPELKTRLSYLRSISRK